MCLAGSDCPFTSECSLTRTSRLLERGTMMIFKGGHDFSKVEILGGRGGLGTFSKNKLLIGGGSNKKQSYF